MGIRLSTTKGMFGINYPQSLTNTVPATLARMSTEERKKKKEKANVLNHFFTYTSKTKSNVTDP